MDVKDPSQKNISLGGGVGRVRCLEVILLLMSATSKTFQWD